MTIQTINIGTVPNDDTGDDPRTVGQKLNSNFTTSTHAASRDVGTASGNVMEVGAGGLLGNAIRWATTDLNDIDKTGFYDIDGSDINNPSGGGHLIHSENAPEDNAAQIYVDIAGTGRIYFNNKGGGVWQGFKELYHSGNLNPNVFGGAGSSDFLMWGWAENANTAVFEARIFGKSSPISITQAGLFNIFRPAGFTSVATNISVTIAGSSSPNSIVLTVAGLSGLTAGESLLLYTVNATSKITVNF